MKINLFANRSVWIRATALMMLALFMIGGFLMVGLPKVNAATPYYNYAEALQKSIFFYDAEKCGPGSGGRLEWRADCHVEDAKYPVNKLPASVSAYKSLMDPDGDGYVDLSGGFHDAGDHVRFGLPQGYAFSTLGWGYYEFKNAFSGTGQDTHMMEILKWFSDCYLRTIWRDSSGNVVAFCYQVGDGDVDHAYWGPPEFQLASKYSRPASFATATTPASDISAEVSAGLAIMYLNYKSIDATYANKCLDVAKAMYTFAKTHRGLGNSGGYYGSAYDDDELSWAATWLYVITGDMQYITDITATDTSGLYTGYMKQIVKSTGNTWQNIWTHCWDVVWAGVFTKLASVFPDNTQFDYFSRWNFEYWSGGAVPHEDPTDTVYLKLTDAGYGMINTWGSARYNTASQFCAMVYQKYHPTRTDISDWALGQMKYIMGDNPMGYSYIVGYGNAWAMHPHHRAAHGSTTNNMGVPTEHKHTLWGALVGGPDASDIHKDLTTDYVYNEVAIDYNAGMVGALAAYYLLYGSGQQPVADFPPKETTVDEFIVEGKVDQENTERTQVTLRIHNDSIHPPRFNTGLGCRYYFNISEMLDAGQTINDVKIEIMYDQAKSQSYGTTQITGPVAVDAERGIYYVQLDWTGMQFFGTMEYQFALVAAQDSTYATHWDPTNDWSRLGLSGTYITTNYVPVYSSGVRVFGLEQSFDPTPTGGRTTPTPTPASGIQVLYRCAETGSSSNTIRPWFRIKNTGTAKLNLETVKIRYWYTSDGTQTETWGCDYASFGPTNVSGSFGKLGAPVTNADSYFEVGFSASAGNVAAGATTSDIQMQFHKNDYAPYTQTNDYSFDPAMTTMTQHTKVAGYINGKLVFGTEPGVVPTSAPTATPSPTPPSPTARFTATPTPTRRGTVTATPTPTRRRTITATPTPTRRGTVTATSTPTATRRNTPTQAVTATPTPTVRSGGYIVSYVIQSDWGNGATINATIINNTTTAVNGWTLVFTFPGNQSITNLWGGTYTQSGTSVSVKNTGSNANIPANGGSVNIGFNINYSGTNAKPAGFSLNGTVCQVQ